MTRVRTSHGSDSCLRFIDLVSFFALFSTLLLKLGKDLVEDLLPKVITRIASSTERKQVRLQMCEDFLSLNLRVTAWQIFLTWTPTTPTELKSSMPYSDMQLNLNKWMLYNTTSLLWMIGFLN